MPIFVIITIALAFTHSHSSDGKPAIGSFTDARDGKKYKTVKIGGQTWMAENLNYATDNSKCYEHSESYCEKYGRLYNWQTAMKACPSGWHLPSKEEWDELSNSVGGSETEGMYLKARNGWNKDGNGQDKYGFAALPGGNGSLKGFFFTDGNHGSWWSSSENKIRYAYYRAMSYNTEKAGLEIGDEYWSRSVRCLQN
jgi:uncharacterized protein (TIGR02145 family)